MGTTGSKVSFDIGEQMEMNTSHSEHQHEEYEHMDKNIINDHNQLIILTNAATSLQISQTNGQIKEASSHPQQTENTPVSN